MFGQGPFTPHAEPGKHPHSKRRVYSAIVFDNGGRPIYRASYCSTKAEAIAVAQAEIARRIEKGQNA